MSNDGSFLIIALIALFIAVCIFVVLRYFVLWYWRIDRIVELMEEQNKLLEAIASDRRPNVSKPIITRIEPTESPTPPRPNPLTGK